MLQVWTFCIKVQDQIHSCQWSRNWGWISKCLHKIRMIEAMIHHKIDNRQERSSTSVRNCQLSCQVYSIMSIRNEPIRNLLRVKTCLSWRNHKMRAFYLQNLTFFNVRKPVCVSVHASKCLLGAVLIQDKKPVAYASRALKETEKRYAQIEKEL